MSQKAIIADSAPSVVDLKNVQGDILQGFAKDFEHFAFFTITNPDKFKEKLQSVKIATADDVKSIRDNISKAKAAGQRVEVKLLNIAFSQRGIHALGIKDDLNDKAFSEGQFKDAEALGDTPKSGQTGYQPDWKEGYTKAIDGVLLGAGDSFASAADVVNSALNQLDGSVKEVYRLEGKTRDKPHRGFEHFGWLDGISNPAVRGVIVPHPGQGEVDPGVILVGQKGDFKPGTKTPEARPPWAYEGSFMAFRELKQLVPEFNKFIAENPYGLPDIPPEFGSQIQCARFFGRWKNGVPIQSSPLFPNPEYLKLEKINNFDYPQAPKDDGQEECPYSAHIRKTRPRSDIPPHEQEITRIMRQGIPYGQEVDEVEAKEKTTKHDRGLAFVCYQSNITVNGFRRSQIAWANNPTFLEKEKQMVCGFDPLIGQNLGKSRETEYRENGTSLPLPQDFIIAKGGEYFFSPSIKALSSVFVGKPYPK